MEMALVLVSLPLKFVMKPDFKRIDLMYRMVSYIVC